MATKRMFSQRIIDSARFIRMPLTTQALYFHLGMRADDDGVVEAYSVLRMTGCTEDDLRVLVAKGFVQVLNEDLVSYIVDWTENNHIRKDRKVDSIYKDLLLKINPTLELVTRTQNDNQMATICQPDDNHLSTSCQPNDGISKDKLSKDNLSKENNIRRFSPPSVEEVRAYCEERKNNVDPESFVNFYESKGWMVGKNKMKDWKAAVRTWERNWNTNVPAPVKKNSFNSHEQREYNYSELDKLFDI